MDRKTINELREKYGIKISYVTVGKQNLKVGLTLRSKNKHPCDTGDRPYYSWLRSGAGDLQRRRQYVEEQKSQW